jgi:sugar phosphate isomerase/epimerase
MQLGLIENAWWNSPIDRIQGVRLAKKIGFDTYDLYPIQLTPQIHKGLREALLDTGMPAPSFIVAAFTLTDFNDDIRRIAIDWVKRKADVGYDMGCETMVLALGEYLLEKQEVSPDAQWRWALEGVREIADYAKSLGMHVAMEFLAHKFALINSVQTVLKFIGDVDHASVKVNADVSHLFLMGDPPKALKRLKGRIVNVHFSDCDGKVHGDLPPGRGVVPLRSYLKALKEIDYRGPVSLELEWSPEPGRIREWVGEAYASTATMMDELGVRG